MGIHAPIGVFDSGVGGLTVAREIMRQIPEERLVYFGDTARLPYGSKSQKTILHFVRQIIRFLETKKMCIRDRDEAGNAALKGSGIAAMVTAAGGAFGAVIQATDIGNTIIESMGIEGTSGGILLMLVGFGIAFIFKAVSYTHLDVYKRQPRCRSRRKTVPAAEEAPAGAAIPAEAGEVFNAPAWREHTD